MPAVRWVAAPVPDSAEALVRAGYPSWLAAVLARRGVVDRDGAERFLHPEAAHLHDPHLLAGMDDAVARLHAAREAGEKVAVVGDYDVDGVSSAALLLAVFAKLKIPAEAVLPHRLSEGYGFQPVHVARATALGCRLIVTADCGSSSREAVEAAFAAGLDVVVTDHHLPGATLPERTIHVNPRRPDCSYPFRDLAAAGLALKLALALARRCGVELDLAALLRVACLGTIADLVPLLGENRVIAALGLKALERARSPGLKALLAQSGMKPPYSASDIGFRLGPRLNAAGRLASPDRALALLMSRDKVEAAEIAAELDTRNRERQAEEIRVVEEARNLFAGRHPLPPILVGWSAGWHKGVVGIAAGRIAKEFHRPTVLLAVEGEAATGSGRSLPGIELHGFLLPWKARMRRFGGHAQAVGMTVEHAVIEELRGLWEEAGAVWPEELLAPRLEYELHLAPREIGAGLLASLARLEPFGQANPRPLVRTGPLTVAGVPLPFGKGHLSARARGEDGGLLSLLGWRWQERSAELTGAFEALGAVEHDAYRGGPVLRLVDVRPVGSGM